MAPSVALIDIRTKQGRDIGAILTLSQNSIVNRHRHEGEENHEAEEVKEKDPATRETPARRPGEAGNIEAQTAAGRIRKGVESCEKIGRSSHCISGKKVFGTDDGHQESKKETESFTR